MPRAYSDDLRCKLLEAYEAGQGSLQELAKQFRVSWGYSKKIRAQQLRTERKERPQQLRYGPASRVDASRGTAVAVRAAAATRLDLGRSATTTGGASRCQPQPVALVGMAAATGLASQKNRSGRKNRTAGRTSGAARGGGNR